MHPALGLGFSDESFELLLRVASRVSDVLITMAMVASPTVPTAAVRQ